MRPSTEKTPLAKPTTIDDVQWLIGPEANGYLVRAAASQLPLVTLSSRLRQELSPERAHLVLEQVDLRRRGREKFCQAGRMFFTRLGLEQATDLQVARHKARRFPRDSMIADLCCGIGGDLLALRDRGAVLGVDRVLVKVLLARANHAALSPGQDNDRNRVPYVATGPVDFLCADVAHVRVAAFDAWHIDPDRRIGRRTTRIETSEPRLTVVQKRIAENPNAAIKLAPAAQVPDVWSSEAELEWISRKGSCRQLVAWFGSLAHEPGKRRATVLSDPDKPPRTIFGLPLETTDSASGIGRYLFDADPAVLAAGLVGQLAEELHLAPIAPGHVYLTGDCPHDDPAAACFEVKDTLPFDLRRVKRLLKDRDIGRLEIKKRAVPDQPEELRKRLRPRGENEATLFVTRINDGVVAILARRLSREEVH